MNRILLTGSTGFVGRALYRQLRASGYHLRCAVRTPGNPADCDNTIVGAIDDRTDWNRALEGCQTVIHLAARVHVVHDNVTDPLMLFRQVNTLATANLARQAAQAGVRRFIFLSTAKVHGEQSPSLETHPSGFSREHPPRPETPYALSKWEAEQALISVCENTGMDYVIIRPPLVYGPHVKANFQTLLKLAYYRVPLPVGAVENRRSFVALENLISLITQCIDHPAAANQVFLVTDGHDLSTQELYRRVSRLMGRRARFLPLPTKPLQKTLRVARRPHWFEKYFGSLHFDASATFRQLNWAPPMEIDEGLHQTTDWFLHRRSRVN